jgi:hypothetical protein
MTPEPPLPIAVPKLATAACPTTARLAPPEPVTCPARAKAEVDPEDVEEPAEMEDAPMPKFAATEAAWEDAPPEAATRPVV